MRNFEPDEVGIFNVASKPLPFKKKLKKIEGATYQKIVNSLSEHKLNKYVIDDSQYLMAFELFDKVKDLGYGKYTDMAVNFRNLIQFIITKTPDNCIVYFLHHTETSDTGKIKAKTCGKMLDNQLTVEGLFSIVLLCKSDGQRHYFETQSDGYSTAKSPMDMFEREIDNDLKIVDAKIREYYELTKEEK